MRSHYWTIGPVADRLRGTPKLKCGTSEEWHEWEERAKAAHPIRWWLAEEGLDYLQKIVYYPTDKLHDLKYYINNRWVSRTHSLTAHPRDIKPGQWQDVGNRFLPCLFNELVDFIEIEKAWSHIAWGSDETKAKYKPPFWASGWFRWRTWRCPQAGLDHLAWEITLKYDEDWMDKDDPKFGKPTPQAERAQEILDLYTWWTVDRPARPDAHDASGWSAYCDAMRDENDGRLSWGSPKSPALKKQSDKALKLLQKIEAAYEKEDEEMMIRLIKARDSLWT